ncbi:hypothetical protein J6590_055547 [Homalodisca vitripennis]|nr:hypothetical protein J6590_055547 [Homalodisca vitripennis]
MTRESLPGSGHCCRQAEPCRADVATPPPRHAAAPLSGLSSTTGPEGAATAVLETGRECSVLKPTRLDYVAFESESLLHLDCPCCQGHGDQRYLGCTDHLSCSSVNREDCLSNVHTCFLRLLRGIPGVMTVVNIHDSENIVARPEVVAGGRRMVSLESIWTT